jgi:3,4-dihydroxy 2-butanone 4-phosphate synthase/GTP cyclohydrolase II
VRDELDVARETVNRAVAELRAGRMIVVADDRDRENEADLIMPAELVTAASLGFMIRHTSGIVCVGVSNVLAGRLGLEPMVVNNTDPKATAFTVSVDAASGIGTGISAADRAHTIRTLTDPTSTAASFTQPGHVFPLRARDEGVLARRGHTEAAVDLCRLAGLQAAGVLCEIVDDRGTPIRGREVQHFAEVHELVVVTIDELATYLGAPSRHNVRRLRTPSPMRLPGATRLPTDHGEFEVAVVRDRRSNAEHVVLVHGDVAGRHDVLVRVHSECATGDLFGSRRCDCGQQLHEAMRRITDTGFGVVIYMRGHEGRGIGLPAKLAAYRLQDEGLDTVDANTALGLPVDDRDYSSAADILRQLGLGSVRLLTNNWDKRNALAARGIIISEVEELHVPVTGEQVTYLEAKRDRLGHDLAAHPSLADPTATVNPISGATT